jgi:hypothetical protein
VSKGRKILSAAAANPQALESQISNLRKSQLHCNNNIIISNHKIETSTNNNNIKTINHHRTPTHNEIKHTHTNTNKNEKERERDEAERKNKRFFPTTFPSPIRPFGEDSRILVFRFGFRRV